jgi:hypothetical protein
MANATLCMSPAVFDASCRWLWRVYPGLSESSGRRTVDRNRNVGGHPASKHLLGMARDLVGTWEECKAAEPSAIKLGLGTKISAHPHYAHLAILHVQGLPVGDPPIGWLKAYAPDQIDTAKT